MKRLTILLAALGALMLVPVAAASAATNTHIAISGNGGGEVYGATGAEGGVPHVECSYASPGPQTGVCDTEAQINPTFGIPAIQVYQKAAPGSAFAGWTVEETVAEGVFPVAGCEPGSEFCSIFIIEGEATIKAVFNKAFTVEKSGGEGTVVGANSGMECTPSQSSCSKAYEGPETLTASPAAGYAFSKWKGCTTAVGLKCEITAVTSSTKVIAYFIPTKTFTVEKAGSGYGKVTSTGISCDESCSTAGSAIQSGKVVKVKAIPAKGSKAAVVESETGSAIGNCPGGEAACEFTIEADSSVKVKFEPKPTKVVTLNLTGPGAFKGKVTGKSLLVKGLVKSSLSCGTGCTTTKEAFYEGDEVELTATASAGYSFNGWTVEGGSAGNCTGKTTPCKAPIDAVKTVSAEFK